MASELEDYKSIDDLKKELKSLKMENIAAMKTIDKLLKDLNKKNEKIDQLEGLVAAAVPVIKKEVSDIKLNIAPEEEIAVIQLERLRNSAKNRSLTLEETRMYDLLVKNKRLSQDESTINLSKANYRDVSNDMLTQIAGVKDTSDNEPESDQ